MREQKRSATLRSKSGDARRVAGQAGGSWYDLTAEDQRLEEEAAARVAGLEAERDAAVEAARRNAEELVEQLRAVQVAALDDLDDRTARDQQVARAADTLAEFQEQVVGMAEKHRAQLAAYDAKIAGFEEMVQRAAQREEEERAALIAQCEATNDAIAERAALHAEENARKIAELIEARHAIAKRAALYAEENARKIAELTAARHAVVLELAQKSAQFAAECAQLADRIAADKEQLAAARSRLCYLEARCHALEGARATTCGATADACAPKESLPADNRGVTLLPGADPVATSSAVDRPLVDDTPQRGAARFTIARAPPPTLLLSSQSRGGGEPPVAPSRWVEGAAAPSPAVEGAGKFFAADATPGAVAAAVEDAEDPTVATEGTDFAPSRWVGGAGAPSPAVEGSKTHAAAERTDGADATGSDAAGRQRRGRRGGDKSRARQRQHANRRRSSRTVDDSTAARGVATPGATDAEDHSPPPSDTDGEAENPGPSRPQCEEAACERGRESAPPRSQAASAESSSTSSSSSSSSSAQKTRKKKASIRISASGVDNVEALKDLCAKVAKSHKFLGLDQAARDGAADARESYWRDEQKRYVRAMREDRARTDRRERSREARGRDSHRRGRSREERPRQLRDDRSPAERTRDARQRDERAVRPREFHDERSRAEREHEALLRAAQEERVYEEQLRETHHNVRVAHVQDAFSHGGGSRDSARRVFVAPPARDVHLEGAGFPEPGATQDAPARRRQRGGDPNRKRERQHANRRTRKQGAEPADA